MTRRSPKSRKFRNQAANVAHSPKVPKEPDEEVQRYTPVGVTLPKIEWMTRPEIDAMKDK